MLCPHCKSELRIADRQSIEIDYCPNCRGVWLDRGELDKILERAQSAMPAAGAYQGGGASPSGGWRRDDDDDDDDRRRNSGQAGYGQPGYDGRRRRKESWLSDLFDFG
jgi:Zn-finger nucleic acid-binding protein